MRASSRISAASSLDLYDMPWTHSLVMALYGRGCTIVFQGAGVGDLRVLSLDSGSRGSPADSHYPRRPLCGSGVWAITGSQFQSSSPSFWYLAGTLFACHRAKNPGALSMSTFVPCWLWWRQLTFTDAPPNITAVAITAEASYLAFAAVAAWLDRCANLSLAGRSHAEHHRSLIRLALQRDRIGSLRGAQVRA